MHSSRHLQKGLGSRGVCSAFFRIQALFGHPKLGIPSCCLFWASLSLRLSQMGCQVMTLSFCRKGKNNVSKFWNTSDFERPLYVIGFHQKTLKHVNLQSRHKPMDSLTGHWLIFVRWAKQGTLPTWHLCALATALRCCVGICEKVPQGTGTAKSGALTTPQIPGLDCSCYRNQSCSAYTAALLGSRYLPCICRSAVSQ